MDDHDTKVSVLKGCSAWLAVGLSKIGVHAWSDAAAMLAALYSAMLICEWVWKKWKGRSR